MQPSGALHIGNYLGALKNFVKLQETYQSYFMVADEHSLTEGLPPMVLREQTLDLAASYLAVGLDPQKSTIFLQSLVPEHAELAWILSTLTPIGELERMTQYKDKAARQKGNVNAGLFSYPVLQAADILLYKPPVVPIGEDQAQHLELTRTIARRFNSRYGETFPEPKPVYTPAPRVMSLSDPLKKMSKSVPQSCLYLTDSPEVIKQKLAYAVTDSMGSDKHLLIHTELLSKDNLETFEEKTDSRTMSPGVANLFLLLREFSEPKTVQSFETSYVKGNIRYSELKTTLARDIAKALAPFQKKYTDLKREPKKLTAVLKAGSKQARVVAAKTLKEVRKKIGLLE